jgi:hypothetical protein
MVVRDGEEAFAIFYFSSIDFMAMMSEKERLSVRKCFVISLLCYFVLIFV